MPICGTNAVDAGVPRLAEPRRNGVGRKVRIVSPRLRTGTYRLSLWFGDGRQDYFVAPDFANVFRGQHQRSEGAKRREWGRSAGMYMDLPTLGSAAGRNRTTPGTLVPGPAARLHCHSLLQLRTFPAGRIDSSLQQSYPNTEVIVVDDGSTDDTATVCEAFLPQIEYLHKPNGGLSEARNFGAHACRGEHVIFLDADDLLEKTFVGECLAALGRNPDAAYVYTQMRLFGNDGGRSGSEFGVTSFPAYDVNKLKQHGNFVHCQRTLAHGPCSSLSLR